MKRKVLLAVLMGYAFLAGCQGANNNLATSRNPEVIQETDAEGTVGGTQSAVINKPEFTHKDTTPIEVVLNSSEYRLASDISSILVYDGDSNLVMSGSIKDVYEGEDVADFDDFIETINETERASVIDRCTVNGKECLVWSHSGSIMYELVIDSDKQFVMSGLLQLPEDDIKSLLESISVGIAE